MGAQLHIINGPQSRESKKSPNKKQTQNNSTIISAFEQFLRVFPIFGHYKLWYQMVM